MSASGQPAASTGVARTHLRVLNAPVPRQPHVSSCRFMLSVGVCRGSLGQPGAPGGFLMPPAPWTATEKAAQPREARLETSLRPAALPLLPQRVEPQPPAHHRHLGRGARAPQGAPPRRGVCMPRPGHPPCPHRGCHPREGLPPYLVETQQLLHFFHHELHGPARPLQAQHVGGRPGRRRQGGAHEEPTGPGQRGRREGAPGGRRFAALAAPRLPRGRWSARGRHAPDTGARARPAPPAGPVPCRRTPVAGASGGPRPAAPRPLPGGRSRGGGAAPPPPAGGPRAPHSGDTHPPGPPQ
jgi:translation initiation factor IF-2